MSMFSFYVIMYYMTHLSCVLLFGCPIFLVIVSGYNIWSPCNRIRRRPLPLFLTFSQTDPLSLLHYNLSLPPFHLLHPPLAHGDLTFSGKYLVLLQCVFWHICTSVCACPTTDNWHRIAPSLFWLIALLQLISTWEIIWLTAERSRGLAANFDVQGLIITPFIAVPH